MRLAHSTARLASALSLVRATEPGRYARRLKLIKRWLASPCGGAE